MKMTISGYYNEPNFRFDIAGKYLKLIVAKTTQNILEKYTLTNVKATELEIYIATDGKSLERYIQPFSKINSRKYLTFHFYLPYSKIVKQENNNKIINLLVLTEEFFECLKLVLLAYDIPETVIETTKQEILNEITGNNDYILERTQEEIAFQNNAQKIIESFKG
jgi:hypothetical protein